MAPLRDYVNYGTAIPVTITLTGLPSTSGRCSTVIVVDTATGMYTDYMGIIQLRTTTGTHASDLVCYAYLFGGTGTAYDSPGTNADGAVTVATNWNLRGPQIINFGTSLTGLVSQTKVFFVAPMFGGEVPAQFGVILQNQTGIALDSTAANLSINFVPVFHTVT